MTCLECAKPIFRPALLSGDGTCAWCADCASRAITWEAVPEPTLTRAIRADLELGALMLK